MTRTQDIVNTFALNDDSEAAYERAKEDERASLILDALHAVDVATYHGSHLSYGALALWLVDELDRLQIGQALAFFERYAEAQERGFDGDGFAYDGEGDIGEGGALLGDNDLSDEDEAEIAAELADLEAEDDEYVAAQREAYEWEQEHFPHA